MSYPKLLMTSVLAGVAAGLVIFLVVFVFRDSFVAAEELDIARARGGAGLLVVIPGLVMGWLVFVAAPRLTDYAGSALLPPLLLLTVAAVGVSVWLVQTQLGDVEAPLTGLSVMAGLVLFGTASVLAWLNK